MTGQLVAGGPHRTFLDVPVFTVAIPRSQVDSGVIAGGAGSAG